MKPTWICISSTVWLLCSLSMNLMAQEDATEKPHPESLPEEIIVIGRDFQELEQLVNAAEDRIYAIFNELNDDDFYDISCRVEARLGTLIKAKVCRPGFLDDANREEALGFLQGRSYMPPTAVINHHAPILQEKMAKLVLEHPEFYQAIDEHRLLREELDAKRSTHLGK